MSDSYEHPGETLRRAAIEYAAAVEAEGATDREWDALRKAAERYRDTPRRRGRWRVACTATQ